MNCDRLDEIHAYHDGELPAAERRAVDAHLASCPACSELLNELRAVSQFVTAAPMAEISSAAMQRLRDVRYILPDRGVLKIAGWLTAAAAAVLISALLYFPREQSSENVASGNASADVLDPVDITAPPPENADNSHSDLVALAEWMADDLSPDHLSPDQRQ